MSNFEPIPSGNAPTAAYRLVQKTLAGELTWSPDDTFKPNYFTGRAYRAEHQGDRLRLYPQIHFNSPSGSSDAQQIAHLEFISPEGKTIWSFPPHQSINDLLMVVERQTGAAEIVESKLRKILESA
jgi:hypothetical protein